MKHINYINLGKLKTISYLDLFLEFDRFLELDLFLEFDLFLELERFLEFDLFFEVDLRDLECL